jgi:hypothetical protein
MDLRASRSKCAGFTRVLPNISLDGQCSDEKAAIVVTRAFEDGYYVCEWIHQKLDGTPVPVELTLVRFKYGDEYVVAAYTRDLRKIKTTVF